MRFIYINACIAYVLETHRFRYRINFFMNEIKIEKHFKYNMFVK